jgi:hypothetical protein
MAWPMWPLQQSRGPRVRPLRRPMSAIRSSLTEEAQHRQEVGPRIRRHKTNNDRRRRRQGNKPSYPATVATITRAEATKIYRQHPEVRGKVSTRCNLPSLARRRLASSCGGASAGNCCACRARRFQSVSWRWRYPAERSSPIALAGRELARDSRY